MANEVISIERLTDYHNNLTTDAHILKRSTAYVLDNIVNKGFIYLKCIQAGTTDSTTLSLASVSVGDELVDGTAKWKVVSINGGSSTGGIALWETSNGYKVNDIVIYNNTIYKCNTAHNSTTFSADSAYWDLIYTNIQNWATSTYYKEGSVIIKNHKLYQCTVSHTSSTWSGAEWQLIGDYVTAPCKVGEIGFVSWQYTLMDNHLALNGATVNDFSATYPELYDFFDTNNLITNSQATYDDNKALLLYDSSTDTATMPDFLSKTVWGGSTIEEKAAGLPNITGYPTGYTQGDTASDYSIGAINHKLWLSGKGVGMASAAGAYVYDNSFDASLSNSIYGSSATVQPPAIQLIPQIRYKKDTFEATVEALYNDTPIGTIISYMGTTAPREYLVCDGTVYNISSYQALADFINSTFGSYDYFGGDGITTFAVPDLRGEFLRGTGTNSHTNQGSGASVGVHQNATEIPNVGSFNENDNLAFMLQKVDNVTYARNADYQITGNAKNASVGSTWSDSVTNRNIRSSVRPTNTSVLYCIKYTVAIVPKSLVDWVTDTDYEIGDMVIYDNIIYRCLIEHTSGTFATDYANGKWQEIGETATTAQIQELFI